MAQTEQLQAQNKFAKTLQHIDYETIVRKAVSCGEKTLIEIRLIDAIAKTTPPLEFLEKYPQFWKTHPKLVFNTYRLQSCSRKEQAPGFWFGVSLILALLPPALNDSGYIWLYRGMSKVEAAKIARGEELDISFYWTPDRDKAAIYAFTNEQIGIICAIRIPASCVRLVHYESEYCIPAFEAFSQATDMRFYIPLEFLPMIWAKGKGNCPKFLSTILNKCWNSLIFKRLRRKIFVKYQRLFYLRIAKRKVMRYEI